MYFILTYVAVSLLTYIHVLIAVAFFTVFERKLMAGIQRRKGPELVGFLGFLQGIADGVKLVLKEAVIPEGANYYLFLFAPVLALVLALSSWSVLPVCSFSMIADINCGVLFLVLISSLNVYPIMLSGWASNSQYGLLGSVRSISQIISYEVPFSMSLLPIVAYSSSLNLSTIVLLQGLSCWNIFLFFPLFIIFLICSFAETNRVPFDLPEAESEIVAGYNVEYASIIFAMFFLAEYSNIIVISSFCVLLFLGGWVLFLISSLLESFTFSTKVFILLVFFVLVRAALPRYRFDQLMSFGWRNLIPLSITLFFFYISYITIFLDDIHITA